MSSGTTHPAATGRFAYVGAYTRPAVEAGADPSRLGISVYAVDAATGALSHVQTVPSDNPSFVALHPSQQFLYAVCENADYEGENSGAVEAYAVDAATGRLTFINRQSSAGAGPTHLAVDPRGDHVVVANYMGESFTVLPIDADGSLRPVSGAVTNRGSGPNADRQEQPHPHGIAFHPSGNVLATADLGIDTVQSFRLDHDTGTLEQVSAATTAPGDGPRHLAFNLAGTIVYVLNELAATIIAFAYDAATGAIGPELQRVSTVPDAFDGPRSTAEIAVHPNGNVLYSSNRGQTDSATPEADAIVAWRIDPANGRLTHIGYTTDGIDVPRNFALDPTGTWLYAANQAGNSIVQFAINQATGELSPTGHAVETTKPVAVVFTGQRR